MSWIYWKEGPPTRMCQTEIMRNVMMLLICVSAFGQPQPPTDATRADRSDVIRTNVNVVIAPTTVRDRSGNFVNGLQLQDFELYDRSEEHTSELQSPVH